MSNAITAIAEAASLAPTTSRAQGRGRTYVLVHGAWFGGWVWKTVADGLRAEGHNVYAPSLTGLGEHKHLIRPGINLDTHAEDIVNLIEMENLKQVVLVGWSYGGMVVTDVLARIPQKISSMVYLDALVPSAGRSAVSYTAAYPLETMVKVAADGKDLPPLAPQVVGITDQAMVDYVTPRLTPHPVLTLLQGSKALPQRPSIPHTYVLAGASPSQTFRPFHKMFQDDPRAQTHVLNTGHTMMMTESSATLEILKNAR